ncbi:transposase [Paraburkholderia sp. NMBU_R16]|uniref:transposase n=1 Tax=Paraburkholderia sp. NMBU_R16 TaxID=2698676 RepID=UPI00349F7006
MSFGRASEWHRQKYGREAGRTLWRKLHLSIDAQMNVHQSAITEDHVSDEAGLNALLAVQANVECVIADGAYYSIERGQAWSACGVLPVIPPPAHAVVHNQPATRWHDPLVRTSRTRASMRSRRNTATASAHWSSRRSRASSAASARGY